MLGEMLQYKNFHDDPTKPPFPWDPEAARWCRSYRKTHPGAFPVDRRELMRPERVKLAVADSGPRKTARIKLLPPERSARASSNTARLGGHDSVPPKSGSAIKPGSKVRIKSSSR
jgi:hypothetical protein